MTQYFLKILRKTMGTFKIHIKIIFFLSNGHSHYICNSDKYGLIKFLGSLKILGICMGDVEGFWENYLVYFSTKIFHCVNLKNLILKWQVYIPCQSKLMPKNTAWWKQMVQSE